MSKKKITEAKDIHVSGDFIAGDQYNYYYTGDFASLAEYYISPEPVFQRVRTDDFIGRDWLTAKVDAFLNDPHRKSGAFLLIGDAGVGKTSFMAHLVKERRYLHLFAEQAPGQAMLQRAMQSLGSQLVTRYQIDPYKDRDTLNALSVFPDFLERIIRLAANTLTEGEKIVIVCDALDEAGTFPDHFVFGLPKELPDGVYFILSQRPANVKLPNFEPVIERLEAQGEGNLQDIEAYLSAVAKRPEVAGQIRSKEYSEEFFIQTLKEKSQGVWMYLHYIIKEIESGARAPLDLANLPTGLVGYYAEYWDAWRTGKRGKGEEAWDELYAPLLTTLAAAQEAIPVDWLIQWADVTAKPREVTRLLTEHWRAFITEKEKNGQKTYIPYHLSFKDFITGRVDTAKLPPAQANLVKDLATQTVDAHKRIVSAFEKECKGEWEKLVEQDYPRLHLTAHLNGAGEYEKLRILLTEGDEKIKWAEAREKKEETYAGYLNDLTYVWNYAEREQNYVLAIRCMLIENSIHSMAANIPPELLAELAKAGIWSYARCLSTIRENSNYSDQAKAIELIAPHLPSLLLKEAITVAQQINHTFYRANAVAALAPYLSEELKLKALSIVREIKDEHPRNHALSALSPYLGEEIMSQAIFVTHKFNSKVVHANILPISKPSINIELKTQTPQEILTAVRKIKETHNSIDNFVKLIPHLDKALKTRVLKEALVVALEIEDDLHREHVLVELAPHLDDKLSTQALVITYEIKDASRRVRTLVALAPQLNRQLKKKVLNNALSIARKAKNEPARIYAFVTLAPYLNQEFKKKAIEDSFAITREIKEVYTHAYAMLDLVPFLDQESKKQLLIEEVTSICNDADKEYCAIALSALAPHLSDEIKPQAVVAARGIKREGTRADALVALAPHLNNELVNEVFEIVCKIKKERDRIQALVDLAPYINEKLKSKVLAVVQETKEDYRAYFLVNLLPYLNNELKMQALQDALVTAREITKDYSRAYELADIAPYLDNLIKTQVLTEALTAAREIEEGSDRLSILAKIAPQLKGDIKTQLLQEMLSILHEIENESIRTSSLEDIASCLVDNLKTKALDIARKLNEDDNRARALAALVPYMEHETRIVVLQEAFFSSADDYSNYSLGKILHEWENIKFIGLKDNIISFAKLASQKDRGNGIEIVSALTPALVHFRGPQIADELYRTITDVTRWWP